jgi:hypothetical protein
MDRKEFIRSSLRWSILGLLVVFSGVLFYRRQIIPKKRCHLADQCRYCGSLTICTLPEALKYRKNEEEERL